MRKPEAVDHLVGYNMSLRRAAFDRFEEALRPYWQMFELDACLQVRRRGFRVMFDFGNVVEHHPTNTAYVGGRDYRKSQFDRASQAQRQAGSAFKPVVYATAFEDGVATPATVLADSPLTVELANMIWEPQNDDDEYRGWVSARTAIEDSLNVPTARLALQVGLKRIVQEARALGGRRHRRRDES